VKKYLKSATRVVIKRNVKNPFSPGNWFETTWGDAVKNNDLTTSSGTVDVIVDLHPSEYANFDGCEDAIRYDNRGAYCEVIETPVHETVYEDGKRVQYDMLDDTRTELEPIDY
jgi:hypothetical protein